MTVEPSPFGSADREALADRGLSEEEAGRQLATFRSPPHWSRLDRPCTAGDGLLELAEADHEPLLTAQAEAAAAGRFTKFVPASGAATRMFRELLYYQEGAGRSESWPDIERQAAADERAQALVRFIAELRRFAFFEELERKLVSRGEELDGLVKIGAFQTLLDALLADDGMAYARLPKGQLSFHCHDASSRTPFEEHLVEAAHYARSADGLCRLHFTVSQEHQAGFERLLAGVGPALERQLGARFAVAWSQQLASTDTLAADAKNNPFRDAAGRLVFRPGGHGALIENLAALGGDLVYVKNIDNVQPESRREATVQWKKLLGGLLVTTERRIHALLAALRGTEPDRESLNRAEAFVRDVLMLEVPEVARAGEQSLRAFLSQLLHRPLRVCGVVRNTGEPGGGPFWTRGADGSLRPQIVESSQVDPQDTEQQRTLAASTHFNPVDLVCALRDVEGKPFALQPFIDRDATIVTERSIGGRDLRALERPGLWNGAMAGWNTLFVEVPLATFTPVKSILDLLRDEHQG